MQTPVSEMLTENSVANPLASPIEQAALPAEAATPATAANAGARRDLLIRAEVLLDRAHFSPGVIDGRSGSNLRNAVSAFQQARNLTVTGEIDTATWTALAQDAGPVTQDYEITAADAAGPYAPTPASMTAMAQMEHVTYTSPREALAERFHMDERLLAALNPEADFAVAGTRILVVRPASEPLPAGIARLEVDKTHEQVRALGADGTLLAAFPATVGSAERPAPTGEWAVRAVAPRPTYTYDPSRLTFGNRSAGRLTIPAGPNNPVGSTWIDLTRDTYGIHGAPDPTLVGKTASHGCVRLTNWDAEALGRAVRPGVVVAFVGSERRT